MKKYAIFLAVFLCLALSLALFSSCSDPEAALYGRWETTIEDEELGKVQMVYHFTKEGEIFLEQKNGDAIPFSIPFGTYSAEKDVIKIVSEGVEKEFSYKISGEILTLSHPDEADLVFYKI